MSTDLKNVICIRSRLSQSISEMDTALQTQRAYKLKKNVKVDVHGLNCNKGGCIVI